MKLKEDGTSKDYCGNTILRFCHKAEENKTCPKQSQQYPAPYFRNQIFILTLYAATVYVKHTKNEKIKRQPDRTKKSKAALHLPKSMGQGTRHTSANAHTRYVTSGIVTRIWHQRGGSQQHVPAAAYRRASLGGRTLAKQNRKFPDKTEPAQHLLRREKYCTECEPAGTC